MTRYSKYQEEALLRNHPDKNYVDAYRKMKRIKDFYVHLGVYLIVNTSLIVFSYVHSASPTEAFWNWQTFSTAFFWGIGLAVHGLSVFKSNLLFGKKWEEKKIEQFMKKDKENRWE